MKLTILGSGCMVPTKERNHSAYFLSYNGEGILLDCGEGTQRQIKKANIKPTKVTKILLSHWHGDHVLGIPGLLDTLSNSEYSKTLEIYGPKGTKNKIKALNKVFDSFRDIKIVVKDIETNGVFLDTKDYKIESYKLNHSITSIGYRFIEKDKLRINIAKAKKLKILPGPEMGKLQNGKTIKVGNKTIRASDVTTLVKGKILSYVPDTALTPNCIKIAKDADLLLCESTYTSEEEKYAKEYKHMTSKFAATVAKKSKAKKLVLTHFSQRYKNDSNFLKDAKTTFKNTSCAKDFMEIEL